VLLVVACTSHDGGKPDGTPSRGTPPVEFRGSIASVSIVQDCPDVAADSAPPTTAAAQREAVAPPPHAVPDDGSRAVPSDEGGWSPPCTQSAMQLNVSHDRADALPMSIVAARLTSAESGAHLAMVPVRSPTRWEEGGRYVAWDERVPAATELEVSYALGEPQWNALTLALGKDDDSRARYILELDLELGMEGASRTITIRSGEFQRDYPHLMET